MAKPYPHSSIKTAKLLADYLDERDEAVMGALITAGAFVALADGRIEAVERDELVNFLDGQRLVPGSSKYDIGEVFDCRRAEAT